MKTLMIAERFNAPDVSLEEAVRWERRIADGENLRWMLVALRMRAFRRGHGQARLQSLGFTWTDSMNLLPPHPRCGAWDRVLARQQALAISSTLQAEYDRYLFVGGRVAEAFRGHPCKTLQHDDNWLVLPHPSGHNRWWNQQSNVEEARRCAAKWYETT